MPRTKKQATTAPKETTPAPQPITAAPAKPRELTEFQKMLADYCGELILRGGAENPVTNLLEACLGHQYRTLFPNYPTDATARRQKTDEWVERNLEDWRDKLRTAWPPTLDAPQADRSTITKRIREDARGRVTEQLNEFARVGTPEEIWLMQKVMQHHESSRLSAMDQAIQFPEIDLATAFDAVLSENEDHFLRVPEEHWKLVQDYLKLLDGQSPCAAK